MPAFVKKAETYSALHYPNGGAPDTRSRINIRTTDDYRLYIIFKADNLQLPPNQYNNKIGIGYEHAHRYPYYLDLLRNEGPIWVTFNDEVPSFVVYAANEPIGEEEL
jgi:hypothetical protein